MSYFLIIYRYTICGTITCLRWDEVKFCKAGKGYLDFGWGYFLMIFLKVMEMGMKG